jgi:hypothetical protein
LLRTLQFAEKLSEDARVRNANGGANETAENIDREEGSSGRTGVQSVVDAFKKNRTHCDAPDSVDGNTQKSL